MSKDQRIIDFVLDHILDPREELSDNLAAAFPECDTGVKIDEEGAIRLYIDDEVFIVDIELSD